MLKSVTACVVLVAVSALSFGTAASIAGEVGGAYVYPVRPGDSQWKDLKSFAEMLDVCQVPERLLKPMSTLQLAEVCMDYPMLNIYTYYPEASAVDIVARGFNGLRELLSRDDAGAAIARSYQLTVARFVAHKGKLDGGTTGMDEPLYSLVQMGFMEHLLAHNQVLKKIDEGTAIEILRAARAKYGFFDSLPDREQWVRSVSAHSGGKLVLSIVCAPDRGSEWTRKFDPLIELSLQESNSADRSPMDLAKIMHLVESALQE